MTETGVRSGCRIAGSWTGARHGPAWALGRMASRIQWLTASAATDAAGSPQRLRSGLTPPIARPKMPVNRVAPLVAMPPSVPKPEGGPFYGSP